jgi:dTDP-4-amino-4,6-dideoxygalactose transaminase
LRAHLTARRIATAIHYPVPLHQTPAYGGHARAASEGVVESDARAARASGVGRDVHDAGRAPAQCPVAERLARRILSLPIYPVTTDEEIDAVAAAVCAFARG